MRASKREEKNREGKRKYTVRKRAVSEKKKRVCYHYSKTNRNLPSVMQKPNHTSARVSDDTSCLTHVSDDTSNLARVSDDISEPIRL